MLLLNTLKTGRSVWSRRVKRMVLVLISIACFGAAAWWWHADEIEQIKYDNQVAARVCWKRYDEVVPGPNFYEIAEGKVERCYEALARDLNEQLGRVTWWKAFAVGALPVLIAWTTGLVVMRRRGT